MTKQTFEEYLKERQARNEEKAGEGKTSRNFSKEEFTRNFAALANDPDYTVEVYNNTSKNEEGFEVTHVQPGAGFRKLVHKVLLDYGVDAQEAETMLSNEYQFAGKSMDDVYEFVSELLYTYTDGGNRFRFLTKYDSAISFALDDVEESTVRRTVPRKVEGEDTLIEFNQHTKAHKRLSAKSAPPVWLKTNTDL